MLTFMHIPAGKGHITAAINVHEDRLTAAMAFCSPKDRFCRRVGRDIASGRLKKNPFFEFSLREGEKPKAAFVHTLNEWLKLVDEEGSDPRMAVPRWLLGVRVEIT